MSKTIGRERCLIAVLAIGKRPGEISACVTQECVKRVDFAPVEHQAKLCCCISNRAQRGGVEFKCADPNAVGRPELLRCGVDLFHAPSREDQVVTRARGEPFGAFETDPAVTACDESCWHDDLFDLTTSL